MIFFSYNFKKKTDPRCDLSYKVKEENNVVAK